MSVLVAFIESEREEDMQRIVQPPFRYEPYAISTRGLIDYSVSLALRRQA